MCGNHHHDDDPHADDHPIDRPVFHPTPRAGEGLVLPGGPSGRSRFPRPRSRRAFLGDFGRGTLAMAVVTPILAACGGGDDDSTGAAATTAPGADTEAGDGTTTTTAGDTAETTAGEAAAGEELRWARANLGFVSAYVLARGNTAAIVDTGVAGSADAIGESLVSLGLTYDDVAHVILTHKHGDHAGSIGEVLERATGAAVYAGEADLDEIDADSIVALSGGEDVFGLEMLSTPGHTAGHMAVIDHTASVLVAGDAIFTDGGGVVEGPARFFDDIDLSRETIRTMAGLSFETLLVGHGDPIEGAADTAVAALADSLG